VDSRDRPHVEKSVFDGLVRLADAVCLLRRAADDSRRRTIVDFLDGWEDELARPPADTDECESDRSVRIGSPVARFVLEQRRRHSVWAIRHWRYKYAPPGRSASTTVYPTYSDLPVTGVVFREQRTDYDISGVISRIAVRTFPKYR